MEMNAAWCSGERAGGSQGSGPLETAEGGCVGFVDQDLALQNWQEQLDEEFASFIYVFSLEIDWYALPVVAVLAAM